MKEKIILIGGGGHCKSCIDVIEQAGIFRIAGIVDVPEKLHQKILGYEIIATDDDLSQLANEYENFLITLGQIKSPEKRIRLFQTLKESGAKLPVIVSPLAYISRHAKIEEGTIVMHYALVNARAKIGENCIINTRALIEHDVFIADHCHIATGATLSGGVTVGGNVLVGAGATVIEYKTIADNVIIGAGSVVVQDIPESGTYFGNPARLNR